jgi:RND family efflux transporter MFP subunit
VVAPKTEGDLASVTLTPDAERRLGIAIVTAESRRSSFARTVAGEVVPASGRSLAVVAPIAGRVAAAGSELRAGMAVHRGDAVLRLTPVAGVDRDLRATADRSVSVAESRLAVAEARLVRAEKLLADGAGAARAVEDARTERDVAKAELDAAKSRLGMLVRSPLEADVAVTLRAPDDGVVRLVSAAPGTLVPAGAPLFELVGTGALWLRVNLFVGDVHRLRPAAPVRVRGLAAPPSDTDVEALPVDGPLTADAASSSFDVYFALPPAAPFRPGERVAVSLPIGGDEPSLGVPDSAVVRDVHGDAWVYAVVGERRYERRRVEVNRVEGGRAELARGLADGTPVVVHGAVPLFGFEFGGGK